MPNRDEKPVLVEEAHRGVYYETSRGQRVYNIIGERWLDGEGIR
jgi:hypothetical protein